MKEALENFSAEELLSLLPHMSKKDKKKIAKKFLQQDAELGRNSRGSAEAVEPRLGLMSELGRNSGGPDDAVISKG